MDVSNFTTEINQIALFAKRISFNIETGCIMELTRLWLDDNKKFYNAIEDNRDQANRVIKTFL